MGTQVLRPQDCLIEKIRDSPCHRRNYNGSPSSVFSPNPYNYNPRSNRKPAVRTERKRRSEPSVSKRSCSVDDLRASKTHRRHNHHHHNHRDGNDHQSLVMEKVTILRRGTSLDSKIISRETASAAANRCQGRGEMVVTGTDRLGPGPEMVPKQIKIVDLRSPVAVKPEVYAGSAFAVSPAPSSLPLPSFSTKKHLSFDDLATRDLRRLLQLDF